jgi:sugar phosphate isomerase/epimerase
LIPIASPLYIVRKEAEKDLYGVFERLAELGFDGVELLGLFGREPKAIRRKAESLGLKILGNHVPVNELLKDSGKVIYDHLELGCSFITISWPAGSRGLNPGAEEFKAELERFGEASRLCREKGITPLYHNHDFEFESGCSHPGSENANILDRIMSSCEKDGLMLEPDLGWMLFMQVDPAEYLKAYSERIRAVHLKDVYAEDFSKAGSGKDLGSVKGNPEKGGFEFRPTGYGILNMPLIMPLCMACNPEWLVLDHDLAYERDSFYDLKLSLDYTKNLLEIMECK